MTNENSWVQLGAGADLVEYVAERGYRDKGRGETWAGSRALVEGGSCRDEGKEEDLAT